MPCPAAKVLHVSIISSPLCTFSGKFFKSEYSFSLKTFLGSSAEKEALISEAVIVTVSKKEYSGF